MRGSKVTRRCPAPPHPAQVLPGAYLPFGDGARKCIGYRFATQEALLALVALYSRVRAPWAGGSGWVAAGLGGWADRWPRVRLPSLA